jgi:hypothetical protein
MKTIHHPSYRNHMHHGKDLSWLSAPAFFLIIGMLLISTKKQNTHSRLPEKAKTAISTVPTQKGL